MGSATFFRSDDGKKILATLASKHQRQKVTGCFLGFVFPPRLVALLLSVSRKFHILAPPLPLEIGVVSLAIVAPTLYVTYCLRRESANPSPTGDGGCGCCGELRIENPENKKSKSRKQP